MRHLTSNSLFKKRIDKVPLGQKVRKEFFHDITFEIYRIIENMRGRILPEISKNFEFLFLGLLDITFFLLYF